MSDYEQRYARRAFISPDSERIDVLACDVGVWRWEDGPEAQATLTIQGSDGRAFSLYLRSEDGYDEFMATVSTLIDGLVEFRNELAAVKRVTEKPEAA